jgi:hypothetical protein
LFEFGTLHIAQNLGNENIVDQDLWQQFQRTVKMQDLAKGINIHDFLPEFCATVDIN